MNFLFFVLGVIVGLLIPRAKPTAEKVVQAIKEYQETHGEVQFIPPESVQEKYQKSDKIDEFLNKLND